MTVDEFRADLEAEIRNDALSFGHGTQATFAEKITSMMRQAEYLNGEYQEAFYVGKHKSRNLRVDGYLQDAADNSIILFTVYYTDSGEKTIKTLAEKHFKLLEMFADAVLTTKLEMQEVECQIWDIERIFAVYNSMQVREPVEIDFTIYGGIPCLRADAAADDSCESFLCVMPGKVLADIYDQYGSRILEGNVRSFLSTKCSVNKKIQATILNKPEKFFAFNNGIAATATQIELEHSANGLRLTSAVDFQIINGGQTTALLSNTRFKNKNNLEKISRRLFAPPQRGVQYQTRWFYERARGQHVQEQMKMTPAKKKSFLRENPKRQVMTKTDFAKYRMSWQEQPNIVSKGAQANFAKFAEEISAVWERDKEQCWTNMKASLRVELPENFSRCSDDEP